MFIDLSHTFTAQMPSYPGDPAPEITLVHSFPQEDYVDYVLKTGMHVGTHIDAPLHMVEGGKRLSELPIDRFVGRGHLLDARGLPNIDVSLVKGRKIERGDIILCFTGFSIHFREDSYYRDYPEVTEAFAEEAVKLGVKIVGLDTPSPDRSPFKVHRILLGSEVLIVENLTNLERLVGVSNFEFLALPPKLDLEGSPVRAVARMLY